MGTAQEKVPLFNSPLETGLRALVVLDAFFPRPCTLSELTWFDHLVVHTADVEGPESLHPDLPSRGGELLVRRRLVNEGINLLLKADLITLVDGTDGVRYVAGDEAPSFIELMEVPYIIRLRSSAQWLADTFGSLPEDDLRTIVHQRLGRWTVEFQGDDTLLEPSA
jgi:hypothetical protein